MIDNMGSGHVPVMIGEVLGALRPFDEGLFVDATLGRGGYSEAILKTASARVIGIDRDPAAVIFGKQLSRKYGGRLTILEGRFGDIERLIKDKGISEVDGITFDLGVSSIQLDEANRGFSFRFDGPLDMRMSSKGTTAADLINNTSEQDLADIIHKLGEERQARRIAKAIVETRSKTPIKTTGHLAKIVRGIVWKSKDRIDPATRTFMALRIWVNDELGELRRGLCAAENILAPGGRLAIVAFHSLEDRIVKKFLRSRSGRSGRSSRHFPDVQVKQPAPSFKLLKSGAIKPELSEISRNARSRSARLRIAERTDSPSWSCKIAGKQNYGWHDLGGQK